MLDANMEIDKLRYRLRLKNLSEQVVVSIADDAANEISMLSTDALANAMEQAVRAGADKKAVKFIEELQVVQNGHHFSVGTRTGRTDFSEPPFPMLPKLLKNAKTANDGSQYKVIPVRQKIQNDPRGRTATTTEAALQAINNARRAAKEERDALGDDYRSSLSPGALKGMSTFAALQQINEARKSFNTFEKQKTSTEPVAAFRTASSKQDANTQWVQPGKPMNMSNELHRINSDLQVELDRIIDETIRKHEDMY